MGTYDLLREYAVRQGWSPSTMLDVLCDFVDSLGNEEALEDFLIERAELEDLQHPEETVKEDDEDEEEDEDTVEKEIN